MCGAADVTVAVEVTLLLVRVVVSGDFGLKTRSKTLAIEFDFDVLVVGTVRWLRLQLDAGGYMLYACSGTSKAVLLGGGFMYVLVISVCLKKTVPV